MITNKNELANVLADRCANDVVDLNATQAQHVLATLRGMLHQELNNGMAAKQFLQLFNVKVVAKLVPSQDA